MAKSAERISDVQEREWTASIGTAVVGIGLLAVAAVVMYLMKYMPIPPEHLLVSQIIAGVAVVGGGAIILAALYRSSQTRKVARVPFPCPFCGKDNFFPQKPTEEFDCEHCDRTVHFENGEPVPAHTIVCQYCRTEHRVPVNVASYLCDSCNRPLRLRPDPHFKTAVVHTHAVEARDEILQNYDVLLIGYDRRREEEIAYKVQNLSAAKTVGGVAINLPEVRRMLLGASKAAPLTVAYDLSQRKADAIRRQLQEIGATVVLRPTNAVPQAAPQKVR
jgi:transposase-like protein